VARQKARRTKRAAQGRRLAAAPDWAPAFLDALRSHGTVYHACASAGVGRSTVYQRRESDAAFRADFDAACQDATDALEREAIRRGVDGYLEPIVYQGRVMGDWIGPDGGPCEPGADGARFVPSCLRKYSDQLLSNLLKWRRYGDRVEISGKDGGPIESRSRLTLDWDELALPRPAPDPIEEKIAQAGPAP
jgi:hypothetical protein